MLLTREYGLIAKMSRGSVVLFDSIVAKERLLLRLRSILFISTIVLGLALPGLTAIITNSTV